ncbi:translocation/assembly module TamB domain-containing protein [uncultured Croceicoccus sp.]|uniref:translocation/assembly module TamB domain-containing protein n=1 Tax=uncultured Croceicoccus sp. TaxID=1295329 RepID=UPI002630ABF7|nr:translocation/assembly module TamB domain-containing protein [uncultured Croceicoccus sp.]
MADMRDGEEQPVTDETAEEVRGDDTMVESGEDTRTHRRWPVRVAKGVAIVLVGIAVLVALVIFGLNTQPGRRFVAEQIAGLEFENGMEIDIGRIDGSLYGEMVLHDFTVSDPRGVFLSSPELRVDWRPFAFVNNHVDVRSATAERITLARLPQFNETESEGPLLPDLDIDIGVLRVDRFVIGEAVTGERRVLSLGGEAHIADGRALVDLDARTIGGADAAGGDRLALKLDAVPEENRLDIDVKLRAPQGGVVTTLAGLDQPVALDLSGRGDWARWNGRLAANLGGSEFARLAILARDGTFTVRGPTRVARLFEGQTAALLGPVTTIDMTGALNERSANLTGTIESDALRVGADGIIDLSDNSFDDMKVTLALTRPSVLAENLSGSGVRGNLTLDGAFAAPTVQYALAADRIAMADMALVNFAAEGAARVDPDRILIPVQARASRITGLDTVAGGTLTDVRLAGDIAIQGPRILSDNMRIQSDRIDANVILLADMSTGLYTGAIDGRIDNYRVESVGIFDITTDVDLRTEAGGYALAGRVSVRSRRLENESVRDFLGGNALASANVRYAPDGTINFTNLRLEAPLVRITGGSGRYSTDGRIAFNADAITDAYGRVGVRVAGTITDPQATITAENPNFGIGLANLNAEIRGTGNGTGYRLDLTGDTDYGALTADVTLGLGDATTVQINSANLGGIDFTGSLRQTSAGPFAGRLLANGRGLAGVVRLDAEGRYQEALFNLRANDTTLEGPANLAIGSAKIDGRVVLYDQPYVVAAAQLARVRYGSFDINAARATVDYRGGTGKAKLLAEGTSGVPFRIALNTDMTPQLWRAAVKGRVRGIDFATVNPARIVPGNGSYELMPTRIDFGSGNLRLAATYGDGIRVQSRLDSLDMAIVNAFVPGLGLGGNATGSLDFAQAGPNAFPRADARLSIDDFTRTTAASVSQPVDINFVGKLLANGGEARAVMRRRGTVIGRMVASLNPLPPGAGPWTQRLLMAPLSGGIRYNGPADTLFSFAGQPDQRLSGPIGVAADFSGRVSDPDLAGIIRAKSLTYENLTYGTRLTNMALQGRFDGSELRIERMTATAGDGSVEASGYVSLAADSGYPMDVSVTLDDARLARSDMIRASATGQLRLSKSAGQTALLSGQLLLPETRYQIIRQGAAEVPELTGVRFKPPRGPVRITGDEEPETQPGIFDQLRLDIDLNAPERLYVSGMGLESEWDADLTIRGTSTAPRLSGEVSLIRGTLGFAGRSFELVEGRIGFTGGSTIDPVLNLVASEEIEDVTVRVNVAGRAMDPQISFASTPGLPQDEIVSRILFGSSIGNLSTIQAVQLAASLNSLRGSGGGLNPLGTLRSATGVDRLRILGADEASGRGTALAAGQYITDDIYVELITDALGFTATQLEISLTPALSILSQAGGSGRTDASIRYRKNY